MTINLQKDYSADKGADPHAFVQQSLDFPITLDLNTLIAEKDPAPDAHENQSSFLFSSLHHHLTACNEYFYYTYRNDL